RFHAHVLKEDDARLGNRSSEDVEVSVSIQIYGLGIDRPNYPGQFMFDPGFSVQGWARDLEPGNRGGWLSGTGALRAFVGGDNFRFPIAIEIDSEDPDEGAAIVCCGRYHTLPCFRADIAPGILEVNKVRQFARANHIEISVAVEIGNSHILGRGSIFPAGERGELPPVGIAGSERDTDVAAQRTVVLGCRLMNRNDVEIAVLVEIRHLESVSTTNSNTSDGFIV